MGRFTFMIRSGLFPFEKYIKNKLLCIPRIWYIIYLFFRSHLQRVFGVKSRNCLVLFPEGGFLRKRKVKYYQVYLNPEDWCLETDENVIVHDCIDIFDLYEHYIYESILQNFCNRIHIYYFRLWVKVLQKRKICQF